MNFKADLEQIINEEFNKMGIAYSTHDLRDLCIHFMNTKLKLIIPQHRRVLKSREYETKTAGQSFKTTLQIIEQKFLNGEEINPHLSKQSLNPDFDDHLLNDWAIHHIHISDAKANATDFFYARSDNLLFALVLDETAYFIDVTPHNEQNIFAKTTLLEIIDNNWPEIIKSSVIKDAIGVSHKCTDEEIRKLRKLGVNVMMEINGKVICSMGLGYTASGDSMKSVRNTHALLDSIEKWEQYLTANKEKIKTDVEDKLGKSVDEIDFKLQLDELNLIIIETTSGLCL